LGVEETAELAAEVAGLPLGPLLSEQVESAGGSPLFVIELVRSLQEDGALDVAGGRAETGSVSLPPTLRLTILRRLSRLSEDTLNVLRVASILGSTFSVTDLALVTGRAVAALVPVLGAAGDVGLLVEAGDRLAFRHVLVRDALYDDLPSAVRMGLHREAGIRLGKAGGSLERAATHVALGAEPGDSEAVDWLRRGAQSVLSRAPATAVRLLERARDVTAVNDALRDVLAAELVEPLVLIGRLREAEDLAVDLLTGDPGPRLELMARAGLASAWSIRARYPEAIEQVELAAKVAGEFERQSLTATGAVLMVLAGQVRRAAGVAERAVEAAERVGNDHALCLALQALALVSLAEGFTDRAVTFARRAVVVAQRNAESWANNPRLWHGTALADADHLDEAEVVLQAGRRQAEQTGNVSRVAMYHWAIAEVRLAAGQWDDAVAEAEAGLRLIEESPSHVGDVFAHAICAHVAYHRGDEASAAAAVDDARRRLVAGSVEIGREWMGWVDALLLEGKGCRIEAAAMLAEAWDRNAPVRYLQAASRAMAPDVVRLALAVGDAQRACSVTEELERSAGIAATVTAHGLALRCRGLLDDDVDALLAAVIAHRDGPRPYQLAAACEDAGTALGRIRRTADAGALLDEATALYEQLDAVHDVARVLLARRALGMKRLPRAPRRPSFGWESLTPTEVRVVDFVVDGLTNREIAERMFVSRRTVATHVEHVLRKLGHSNRVELAADAARRAITSRG
jgi:DNA-binding NarL/FixJ family response regulator/tetratricopeptide (TPR) repeat protein